MSLSTSWHRAPTPTLVTWPSQTHQAGTSWNPGCLQPRPTLGSFSQLQQAWREPPRAGGFPPLPVGTWDVREKCTYTTPAPNSAPVQLVTSGN